MKIEDIRKPCPPVTIHGRSIPVGTVFMGAVNGYTPSTYLRTYDAIVNLADPNQTWGAENNGHQRWPEVVNYQPVHGRIVIERNA